MSPTLDTLRTASLQADQAFLDAQVAYKNAFPTESMADMQAKQELWNTVEDAFKASIKAWRALQDAYKTEAAESPY